MGPSISEEDGEEERKENVPLGRIKIKDILEVCSERQLNGRNVRAAGLPDLT